MLKKSIYQYGVVGKFLRYKVKALAVVLLNMICEQLPSPTKENTYIENSHTLIDLRDRFLSHEILEGRRRVWEGLFNLAIMVYDFDAYYTERFNWLFWKIKDMEWVVTSGKEYPRNQWWLDFEKYPHGKDLDADLAWLRSEKIRATNANDMERVKQLKVVENLVAQRYPRGSHGV